MRHVPDEAIFEAQAPGQSRRFAVWRRWTGSFPGGKRIGLHASERCRSAIPEHHGQSTVRPRRRGNGGCQSCDIPPLRQGKRHRWLHAGGARLRLWPRLRRLPRLRLSRLRRLQRVPLWRLRRRGYWPRHIGPGPARRLWRLRLLLWWLRLWQLLRLMGRLPLLLISAFHLSSPKSGSHREPDFG
jgi:hypothetical protein